MTVKISILVAVYNGARFLQEMIDSVKAQTFTDYELVLVNDASTDNSLSIMEEAAKNFDKIKIVTYPQNKKLPGALNEGLRHCAGEYIYRLDADDLLVPETLQKQYEFLQKNPAYDGVICDELKVDVNLKPQTMLLKLGDDYFIKKQNLFRTAFGGPTLLLKKEKFFEAGLHDEYMKVGSDRFMALDMHRIVRLGHLPERLYIYRLHNANISQNNTKFKQSAEYVKRRKDKINSIFKKEDYINDWNEVKRFKTLKFDHPAERAVKYGNVILKCALWLAANASKKEALTELKKAKAINPKLGLTIFKLAIIFGVKNFDKLYQNMNIWTNYKYDDFRLVDVR